jgi:riboflavin biosynthesis pyrimidine reductase
MVSTADGRATLEGRAGPIGNQADRELFHHLRTRTDAVWSAPARLGSRAIAGSCGTRGTGPSVSAMAYAPIR